MKTFYNLEGKYINVDLYLLYHHLLGNIKIPKKYLFIDTEQSSSYVGSCNYIGFGMYTCGHWIIKKDNIYYELENYDNYLVKFVQKQKQIKYDKLIINKYLKIDLHKIVDTYKFIVTNGRESFTLEYE